MRQYRVRYMNRGSVLQQTTAPYGSMVLYDGDTPTYTSEETAYKYYLFSGWDKGGYVNGDKDINAVYDICEYVSGYFRDKQLSDLRPVEIYAMTKVNLEQSVVSDKDAITIKMGNDFTFSDVEEKVLFNEPKIFTGKNYVDTGVSLLSEDRSWVMALDYRIDEDSAANSVIAQCFQTNGILDGKADDLSYNDDHTLQLLANGKPIGSAVKITQESVETEDGSLRVVPF